MCLWIVSWSPIVDIVANFLLQIVKTSHLIFIIILPPFNKVELLYKLYKL